MKMSDQLHAPSALPPYACLDAVAEKEICCQCLERNPGFSARNVDSILTEGVA